MNHLLFLGQQSSSGPDVAAMGGLIIFAIFVLAFAIFMIVCMWKVFEKAGQPGWAAIVPIYNLVVLIRISSLPMWFIILLIIPYVNLVAQIILVYKMSVNFGKGAGFTLGMIFLPFIFWPILAFGSAEYCPADLVKQEDEFVAIQ